VVCPTFSEVDPRVIVTLATGTGTTVTVGEVPLTPSQVAVTVTVPGVTPVIRPVVPTVATVELLDIQATGRPERMLPCASRTTATAGALWPTVSEVDPSETVTLATGTGETVTVGEAPLMPSLVAVTFTVPGATAVITPPVETVATAGLLDAHATARPVRRLPCASRTVAVAWVVCPTMRVAELTVTVTDATDR
jgi:hypothetical protein